MVEKFAVFKIGEENFGISINKVVEILKLQKVYSIPELPGFVSGVINVRGEVIPLLDLRLRFGLRANVQKGRIITVRCAGDKIGLLVDDIEEIISLDSEDIAPSPAIFKGLRTEYLTGLGKREDKIIILLNLDSLLTSEEKIMLGKSAERIEGKDAGTGKTA